MAARGHRVTLFASRFPGSTQFDAYDGIDVVRYGSWYNANFMLPQALRAYLQRERVDLILEDINKIPFLLPWYTDVPIMPIIPHLFGATVFRETNPVFGAYVYLWERLIPRVYRNNRFAVISPSTRDDLVARGISRDSVDVVLCGLDHATYRVLPGSERSHRPTIIHFGRLRKYKGVDIVLLAFAKIRETLPDARLVIVGDGPGLPALRHLAGRLHLGDSVDFTGHLPTAELVASLNRVHLFLNASPKEGWGLTVVEANACGVPVVASDRPGLRDSVLHERTGYLVPYGDVGAFARRAVEILGNPDLWRRFSAAGMEWARSLTWDRCADEMEKLFVREAGSIG